MINGQIDARDIKAYIESQLPGIVENIRKGGPIEVTDWQPSATDEQKAQVNALIASLDTDLILAQCIYQKNYAALNIKTAAIEAVGFTYNGGTFHCDAKGISNIQSMMIASMAIMYPYTIYDESSTWTFSSASDIVAMGAAVLGFVSSIENAAKPLRDALAQQANESSLDWLARMQNWKEIR